MKITLIFSAFIFSIVASANELRLSRKEALAQGFKPFKFSKSISSSELPAQAMAWPVKFIDASHTIGNSMPEYQNYGTEAYYHEGADLRVSPAREVTAPVAGFLQGDFYTYVTDQNTGEDKKYTKPYSDGGDTLYFEITIRTTEGFQLEMHHVNPESLPKNIIDLILRGGGEIRAGEVVGFAAIWPNSRAGARYDHIHYNLISPAGVYMNPEYFSQPLADESAPLVKNIYAVYKDKTIEVLNQKLQGTPLELIVSAIDMKGENIYPLPPVLAEAAWGAKKTAWDFSKYFLNSLGGFPDIREVYARNVRLSSGKTVTTKGDYSSAVFLFRLKTPAGASGPVTITLKDSSENTTQVQLNE